VAPQSKDGANACERRKLAAKGSRDGEGIASRRADSGIASAAAAERRIDVVTEVMDDRQTVATLSPTRVT